MGIPTGPGMGVNIDPDFVNQDYCSGCFTNVEPENGNSPHGNSCIIKFQIRKGDSLFFLKPGVDLTMREQNRNHHE